MGGCQKLGDCSLSKDDFFAGSFQVGLDALPAAGLKGTGSVSVQLARALCRWHPFPCIHVLHELETAAESVLRCSSK